MKVIKPSTIILSLALFALLFACTGCGTVPKLSPAVVQQGVTALVGYSAVKYTNAVPALRVAESVICAAANSTNLVPAQIVAAIESSNWSAIKTPEATLILNGVLSLYIGAYESFGADAVNNSPQIKLYLQAVCSGLGNGLPDASGRLMQIKSGESDWPLLKLK